VGGQEIVTQLSENSTGKIGRSVASSVTGKTRNQRKIIKKSNGRDNLRVLKVNRWIILKLILENYTTKWIGFNDLKARFTGGFL
jgi:hypothetical protein